MCSLAFLLWDKIPDMNNLRGGKICFGSGFQRCQSIMAGRAWQSRATHIMEARKQRKGMQEGARERQSQG
jgi:geranylgeranyl pyrophosphate synthase